jgi:uncharacterized protein
MDVVGRVFSGNKTIAVVGASANPRRPSHGIVKYLKAQGLHVIPVNPALNELLGDKCYPDLLSIPDHVDVVDIFRRPDAVPEIIEQAIAKLATIVWMQPGAENVMAAERASSAGLEVIMGVCIMAEHRLHEAVH